MTTIRFVRGSAVRGMRKPEAVPRRWLAGELREYIAGGHLQLLVTPQLPRERQREPPADHLLQTTSRISSCTPDLWIRSLPYPDFLPSPPKQVSSPPCDPSPMSRKGPDASNEGHHSCSDRQRRCPGKACLVPPVPGTSPRRKL